MAVGSWRTVLLWHLWSRADGHRSWNGVLGLGQLLGGSPRGWEEMGRMIVPSVSWHYCRPRTILLKWVMFNLAVEYYENACCSDSPTLLSKPTKLRKKKKSDKGGISELATSWLATWFLSMGWWRKNETQLAWSFFYAPNSSLLTSDKWVGSQKLITSTYERNVNQ